MATSTCVLQLTSLPPFPTFLPHSSPFLPFFFLPRTFAFTDYLSAGVPAFFGTDALEPLITAIDPLLDAANLTMSKLVVDATGACVRICVRVRANVVCGRSISAPE